MNRPLVPELNDPLQIYLREVRKIPIFSPQEERSLATRYKEEGDMKAAYKLVTSNLRLVLKIALEYHRRWLLDLMDLIQEGNLGLIQAVKKFDPCRGVRLSSYSAYWIRAYILKFIMDNWRMVKIGTTLVQRRLFFNLRKEKNRLEKMGFYPGPGRLAAALGTDEEKVIEMEQRLGGQEQSLDYPVRDRWRETLGDMLSLEDEVFDTELADNELQKIFGQKLNEYKVSLNDKELEILEERILSEAPLTLKCIGDRYGITKERVRQVENRIKLKIKQNMQQVLPELSANST